MKENLKLLLSLERALELVKSKIELEIKLIELLKQYENAARI
jgi:hypothetical protein